MATRFEKILWALLCGTALGMGTTGCYESDDQTAYGPPPDVQEDGDDDVDAADVMDTTEEEPIMTAYGPAPEYGPPSYP